MRSQAQSSAPANQQPGGLMGLVMRSSQTGGPPPAGSMGHTIPGAQPVSQAAAAANHASQAFQGPLLLVAKPHSWLRGPGCASVLLAFHTSQN